ncbi:uncharacterized protein LOC107040832 [Diachasma alloeum]|uniref:uncharacterized protein LOC107040832 n=1 Tax=Diachasma alloeum TaxID=454923 RepID=UPI0007382AD8|nr:uncharacterized protein LOC107040832 [Diachasma alloeum]
MNKLREQFCILSSRSVVQSVVRKCVICRRFTAKRLEPNPIPLPENRVGDAAAFEVTGVDLAGPLFLTEGEKSWVVLFTCAVYSAIHLELVKSLSTDAFLEALRRFIARRGSPVTIYCDNGTNFVGAFNALRGLDWDAIVKQEVSSRIECRFSPPLAAWWRGWWERLVCMVKELLRRTLGKACLAYEELSTTLCDYLREYSVPDLDKVDTTALNKRVKYRQRLRQELRQRFRVEYLGQLTRAKGPKAPAVPVAEGDLVFVGNDNKKRVDWPMGRVVQLFPGKDGEVRVVKVKTGDRYMVRPVQRLYPVEMSPVEAVHFIADRTSLAAARNKVKTYGGSTPHDPVGLSTVEKELGDSDLLTEYQPKENVEITTRRGRVVHKPKRLLD